MREQGTKGRVIEELPNMLFKVQFPEESGHGEKLCHLSGKMKLHKIKVSIADYVEVVIDPYGGKTTNRIIRRL